MREVTGHKEQLGGKSGKGVRNLFRSTPNANQVTRHCETNAAMVRQHRKRFLTPFLAPAP